MKIKEVCERTGLTRRAVRFYEEKGLISPEIREENEYRDYTETDVRRLQLVARLRGYRFSVEEIRRLLERPQETQAVFAAHRQELADEQEEGAAILESLERLRLPDSGAPESLYEALCRAEDEGAALPPRDLEPDFGRFDELTREERAELSRRAAENVEHIEKKAQAAMGRDDRVGSCPRDRCRERGAVDSLGDRLCRLCRNHRTGCRVFGYGMGRGGRSRSCPV